MSRSVNGRQDQWQLLEQVGKGDAGEVLRVKSQSDSQIGLMKRPVQNASGGTILRQAVQIENEGQILVRLNGLDASRNGLLVHTPILLDQSIPSTSQTVAQFIISEEVPGVAISSLLHQVREEDVSLSHVLVLRVLSGLFLLLAKAHERGIAWNDVKMEHIFWDETSGKLSFIDWGNGIFLSSQQPANGKDPIRMDYQQFISEANLLLNQIVPELLAELDWPKSAENLTQEDLTSLQIRTEYMLSYLSMRVIDYQLLFRKQLRSIYSLNELEEILELKNSLEKMGVKVEKDALLQAIQKLALAFTQKEDYPALGQLVLLIKQYLPDEIGDVWMMADYLLNITDACTNPSFPELLKRVFSSDWAGAVWLLESIRERAENPAQVSMLLTLMRKSAGLPANYAFPIFNQLIPLRDDVHLQLIHRHIKPNDDDPLTLELESFSVRLDSLLENWQRLIPGEMLGDKLLALRELLRLPAVKLLSIPRELPKNLNLLLSKLREFFTSWAEGDLEACQRTLRELFLLEPSLSYLQQIDAEISTLQQWINKLSEGPQFGQSLTRFAEELVFHKPNLEKVLSQPAWLSSLYACVSALKSTIDLESLRERAQQENWLIPWVEYSYITIEIPKGLGASVHLNDLQLGTLKEFHQALQRNQDPTVALQKIRANLPEFYREYNQLEKAFSSVFSVLPLSFDQLKPSHFPKKDEPQIREALAVLDALQQWKAALSNSNEQENYIFPEKLSQWSIIQQACASQRQWQEQLLPVLMSIRHREWNKLSKISNSIQLTPDLAQALAYLNKLVSQWQHMAENGLHPELTQELIFLDDQAQELFFRFWQALDKDPSAALRWIVQAHQAIFSEINQALLQIARHLRSLSRAIDVINQPEMAISRLARNSAGELMFALSQLSTLIEPQGNQPARLQIWQAQYSELLKLNNWRDFLQAVQELDELHPLLPWVNELVSRDIDIFTFLPNQKW